jgi:hypothetical protein
MGRTKWYSFANLPIRRDLTRKVREHSLEKSSVALTP